jgi:hypothetical protein
LATEAVARGLDGTKRVLGDQPGERFQIGHGKEAQIFTFVGNATDASGNAIGIVGEKDGSRFLFTDKADLDPTQALTLQTPKADGTGQWSLADKAPLCFMPGTLVATPDGEAPVEALQPGDLVLTSDSHAAPIRWIGRQTIARAFGDPMRTLPIRIRAGALGSGLPRRDLRVSPDHALLLDGVLVQAGALVNGTSILRDPDVPAVFTYLHVELHDHSLVLAEGTPAETFIDNVDRMAFDNWSEHEAISGIPAPMTEMALPRVRSARQLPRSLRARLQSVAATLPAAPTQLADVA